MFGKRKKTCMEIEIMAQSKILQMILDEYVDNNEIKLNVPKNINRIDIIASGSSYHCARYAAELFGTISKIEARAVYSSEFLLKDTIAHQDDLLYIFITQSGETTDTNSALEKAKSFNVKTLCITNKENSTIWNASDYHVACHAGEEKSIAATKSFTSQLLCSTLLALKFAQDKGIDIQGLLQDLKMIPDAVKQAYALAPKIKQVAKFMTKYKQVIVTAEGQSYALAKEMALKTKETSYVNANAVILGEFMHGHVAVLNNKKAMLVYISNAEMNYTSIKNLSQIKENYSPAICIIGSRTNQVKSTYNLDVKCDTPIVKTFCIAVIIQLLALNVALKLHRNVDKPHGLNKVVK